MSVNVGVREKTNLRDSKERLRDRHTERERERNNCVVMLEIANKLFLVKSTTK